MSIKPNILVIDNYDSFTFNLVQCLKENGGCTLTVKFWDQIDSSEIINFDKILISPGPGVPDEKPILKQIILEWGKSKSILGVCLGHQAIAETFGASLANLSSVRHGIDEEITILDENEYLFAGLPNIFTAGLYHSWVVESANLPASLKITAVTKDNLVMALSHSTYDIKGVQFHPESYITGFGRNIIDNWIKKT